MPLEVALEEQLERLPEYSVNRKDNGNLGSNTFYYSSSPISYTFFLSLPSPRSTKFASNSQYSASKDSGLKIPKEVSKAKSRYRLHGVTSADIAARE